MGMKRLMGMGMSLRSKFVWKIRFNYKSQNGMIFVHILMTSLLFACNNLKFGQIVGINLALYDVSGNIFWVCVRFGLVYKYRSKKVPVQVHTNRSSRPGEFMSELERTRTYVSQLQTFWTKSNYSTGNGQLVDLKLISYEICWHCPMSKYCMYKIDKTPATVFNGQIRMNVVSKFWFV